MLNDPEYLFTIESSKIEIDSVAKWELTVFWVKSAPPPDHHLSRKYYNVFRKRMQVVYLHSYAKLFNIYYYKNSTEKAKKMQIKYESMNSFTESRYIFCIGSFWYFCVFKKLIAEEIINYLSKEIQRILFCTWKDFSPY